MTAFEYMASLGSVCGLRFYTVETRIFALFTVESEIGPWRNHDYCVTEEGGVAMECLMGSTEMSKIIADPRRLLTLPLARV